MNTNLSRILDILSEVETIRKKGSIRVCELLSLDPTSTIGRILVEKDIEPAHQRFSTLLEEVSQIAGEHGVRRNITDWPFENFWGNPDEPKHSRLLKYFIDPREKHGCGLFLLRRLLSACDIFNPELLVDEACEVTREDQHIDLQVTRNRIDCKYAIIFENKINRAPDQERQLRRYVDRVYQRGFAYNQIYVFYLPLASDKHPEAGDRAAIQNHGVKYTQITFEKHILNWLDKVIERNSEHECPKAMCEGMRENLSHYRSLIRYLNQKQKEREMNAKILEQLKLAEQKNELPTLSDLETLKQSIESLQQCMQQVLRGKLLLEIQGILKMQGEDAWLCLENKPTEKIYDVSPYDELFGNVVDLCVCADEAVSVCFGCHTNGGFWLGYMRSGSQDKQKEAVILSEAQEFFNNKIGGKDDPWYAWDWRQVTYNDCVTKSPTLAKTYSETLVRMRRSLVDRLKVPGGRS